MNKKIISLATLLGIVAMVFSACDTPTGAGAAYGAGAGALIGAAATGRARWAAVGAAAGAATGALVGHAIQEDRARAYGAPPPGGWPYARRTSYPNIFRSPYTGRTYDLSAVPPGGLTRDVDTGQYYRRPY